MQVNQPSYICESVIGSGSFATVFRARHKTTPIRVAIKVIKTRNPDDEAEQMQIRREISILQQMNHPFIAKLFFATHEGWTHALVQEYAPNGTLLDFVLQNGPLPEEKIQFYFLQLVAAVDYLHNVRKVAHRDLKLENVLLDAHDNIKLIDFGLSNVMHDDGSAFSTICGSPEYLAPEVIMNGEYTQAADIWSLGVIMYALATTNLPFDDDDRRTLFRNITGKTVLYPSDLSPELIDLMSKMLCRNPRTRLTIDQIKVHPWFPREQYFRVTNTIAATPSLSSGPPRRVEPDVIRLMVANGLDCHSLTEELQTGEENEMTVLYGVYLRQLQCQWMHYVLQISKNTRMGCKDYVSMPIIELPLPGIPLPNPKSHGAIRAPRLTVPGDQESGREVAAWQRKLRRPEILPPRRKFPIQRVPLVERTPTMINPPQTVPI
jgi:serine/threonine protein kinase